MGHRAVARPPRQRGEDSFILVSNPHSIAPLQARHKRQPPNAKEEETQQQTRNEKGFTKHRTSHRATTITTTDLTLTPCNPLQSSRLTQHNTKPQKTVKKAPKQKKEKTSPERLFFSSGVPFPLRRHWRFVRARKEEQTTTTRPQKKNRVCYKDTKRGGFRFCNFLEMGITEMRRTRHRLIHRCRSAYENTKKWNHKQTTKTESGEKTRQTQEQKTKTRRRRRRSNKGEEQAQVERVSRTCSYRGYYSPKVNHNQLTVPRMRTVLFTPQGR